MRVGANQLGLLDSLLVSVLGMAVVFLVLVILNYMIKGLSIMSRTKNKKSAD